MIEKIKQLAAFTLAQLNSKISDANVPPEVRDIATTEGIQGGGNLSADRIHKLDIPGLTDLPDANMDNDYVAIWDNSAGIHKKISLKNFTAGRTGRERIYVGSSTKSGGHLVTLVTMSFLGTNILGVPSKICALAKRRSGTGEINVQDITNAQTIANKTGISNYSYAVIDLGTISNTSTGQAIWEIQGKKINIQEIILEY